jgi:hypothetical protein
MSSNSAIIQKADFTLADLANGGLLNPEQAATFIRNLQTSPTILNQMRTVVMSSPQRNINKIGFADRILMPATSGVALDEDTSPTNRRSKPTTDQVVLTTKEVIAEVRLPYDVIEDNIERGMINADNPNGPSTEPVSGGFKDTIMALIAERAAIDLEELALLGDTGSGDAYLAMLDGFLVDATSNVVDQGGAVIDRAMFKGGIQTLPDQYKKVLASLKNFVSMDNYTEYQDTRANRETNGGDAANDQLTPTLWALGTKVEGAAVMPAAQGLFCNPNNMIFGIQRQMSIEVDKIITQRVFVIVLTMRIDFKYEEEEAVVKYINIG